MSYDISDATRYSEYRGDIKLAVHLKYEHGWTWGRLKEIGLITCKSDRVSADYEAIRMGYIKKGDDDE